MRVLGGGGGGSGRRGCGVGCRIDLRLIEWR